MHEGFTVGNGGRGRLCDFGKQDPLAAAGAVLAGIPQVLPLHEEEIAAFFPLLAARTCCQRREFRPRKSLVRDDP